MHTDYMKVTTCGFTAYCDALIARKVEPGLSEGVYYYRSEFKAFLLSLVGTSSYIKTISAQVTKGEQLNFDNDNDKVPCVFYCNNSRLAENTRTVRVRKIGETVNKIIVQRFLYEDQGQAAIVFGRDMVIVKERAFRRLDMATTIPLKRQWLDWLWDEVLEPEELFSFGGKDLRHAYLVSWPDEAELQEMVIAAVKDKWLN
jgi:hypothetical protein